MAITGSILYAATTVTGMVVGNQAKQKAKGQAGQIEADSAAAQAAADAKLKQAHDANIQQQSQAAAAARTAAAGQARPSTLISPDLNAAPRVSPAAGGASQLPAPVAPLQRKTLLGQ